MQDSCWGRYVVLPSRSAGGVGGGPLGVTGALAGLRLPLPLARKRPPTRPPPQAGEGFVGGNRHRFQSMIVGIIPPFRSICPPILSGDATLFRAYRTRPRARLSRRRAYRAPDCARASRRRAHLSCQFRWVFFALARGGRRSGFRMPLPPVSSYHGYSEVKPLLGIFSPFRNKLPKLPGPPLTPATAASARRRPACGR